jgi:hypothetical protein
MGTSNTFIGKKDNFKLTVGNQSSNKIGNVVGI